MPASIVLADDHPLVLNGLERLFEEEPEFRVVARCVNGDEALTAVRRSRPDLLLLDLKMPPTSGLEVLRRLQKESLSTRVVILTATLDADELAEAMKLGVRGVVLKDAAPEVLLRCLRRVHSGGTWLDQPPLTRLLEQHQKRSAAVRAEGLTPREAELVRLIAVGRRNKDVALALGITEGTVKIHLHRIYEKLGVDGRLALAVYARENGLL